MVATEIQPSKCLTAWITAKAYQELVDSKQCGGGVPCLRDDCEFCCGLNDMIDRLGAECEARGCTMRHCVHDHDQVSTGAEDLGELRHPSGPA